MTAVYLILFLFIEVMVTSQFVTAFGGLALFLEIIASAVVGVIILQRLHLSMMENLSQMFSGRMSEEAFVSIQYLRFFGAVLMVIPGVFTDVIGLLLQWGSVSVQLVSLFRKKHPPQSNQGGQHHEIIDVEVVDDDTTRH